MKQLLQHVKIDPDGGILNLDNANTEKYNQHSKVRLAMKPQGIHWTIILSVSTGVSPGVSTGVPRKPSNFRYFWFLFCIFWIFDQILGLLIKITWILSFSSKNDAESLCHFVKIPFLDLKRAKLDQNSDFRYVRTCQDLSRRISTYCKPAEILFFSLFLKNYTFPFVVSKCIIFL